MLTRRTLLTAAAFAALPSLAVAFELEPYDPVKAQAAIDSGKPVVLHVYADWCLQCQAQKNVLEKLKSAPEYNAIAFFRVDYDNQKVVYVTSGDMDVARIGGRWLITNMVGATTKLKP